MNVIRDQTKSCATAKKAGEVSTAMVSSPLLSFWASAEYQSARMMMLVLLSKLDFQRAMVPGVKAMTRMIWCVTRED